MEPKERTMQATQQQTFREPRIALAAVMLAVAFSTGTVLGLAIGVSRPQLGSNATAAPLGDRSYDAIEESRAAGRTLTVAGDRSYDAIEESRAVGGSLTIAGDRSYDAIEDVRSGRGVTAPAGNSFQNRRSHGPLEFD
jgi:hypothetical protein